MKLIILESPNKVKTIKSFLTKDYVVTASLGHCLAIANTGKYQLGIDVDNDFGINYNIIDGKDDLIKNLKQLSKQAETVIFAMDNDREGFAIAWHLKQLLKLPDEKCQRVVFNEITQKCVLEALANPIDFNIPLVEAQETRACIDKIIGYRISPVLMQYMHGRSAGRVQSAALSIIVDREKEIRNFKPTKYYEIELSYKKDGLVYQAKYIGTENRKIQRITSESHAKSVINECSPNNYYVKNIHTKERKIQAKIPFTTSTYQQECSSKLGMPPKIAMDCAQKLFEGINIGTQHTGLITYIRTDSSRMDPDFKENLYDYVKRNYGAKYLGKIKEVKSKNKEQAAHECLRCVDLSLTPEHVSKYINDDKLLKVYALIYNRTIAAAMSDCVMSDTEITINNNEHLFSTVGHFIKFDGYRLVYHYDNNQDDLELFPKLKIDEKIEDLSLQTIEKQTQPPKRFSEAGLIKAMEDSGIGRPSTYASCITILKEANRNYTKVEKGSIRPTEHGILVSDYLQENFGDLLSVEYTSKMESLMDEIADGGKHRIPTLENFYKTLCDSITTLRSKEVPKEVEPVGRNCPECNNQLIYKMSKKGTKFIGCLNYPSCKHVEWIEDNTKQKPEVTNIICPNCGKPLVKRVNSKNGNPFLGCSGFPKCKYLTNDTVEQINENNFLNKIIYDRD